MRGSTRRGLLDQHHGWRCEPGVGSFYHYFRGRLERLWAGITIPNAICFSPDGTIAYYCDTPSRTIMRVATDPRNGRPLAAPETFLGPLDGSPMALSPMQMAISG